MNVKLKRMFESDCSYEEAQLHAAVLGKTYEECKQEWAREHKKEFVLDNANMVLRYDYAADMHGKLHFDIAANCIELDDKLFECDGVEAEAIQYSSHVPGHGPMCITVSFYDFEIDGAFMKKVRDKIDRLVEMP